MRDGQSLLDEMSRPIKNAFGKDISPDYTSQTKHIMQKLEELQERKMRCDDLAEVRKLKLQQTLQLRTCERDVDQVPIFARFSAMYISSVIFIKFMSQCFKF